MPKLPHVFLGFLAVLLASGCSLLGGSQVPQANQALEHGFKPYLLDLQAQEQHLKALQNLSPGSSLKSTFSELTAGQKSLRHADRDLRGMAAVMRQVGSRYRLPTWYKKSVLGKTISGVELVDTKIIQPMHHKVALLQSTLQLLMILTPLLKLSASPSRSQLAAALASVGPNFSRQASLDEARYHHRFFRDANQLGHTMQELSAEIKARSPQALNMLDQMQSQALTLDNDMGSLGDRESSSIDTDISTYLPQARADLKTAASEYKKHTARSLSLHVLRALNF